MYSQAGLAQSRLWPAGTVCVTIAANIADSAILSYPACFPDSVVGFVADPELCIPEYVELFIRTARANLSEFAPATAQKNINLAILGEVLVPLPPPEEQQEIVRRVEALFALADALERRVQAATARAERLTQAILAKAFRGELVPTEAELARREGREYEPAAVLLERVRAAKAGAPVARRIGKRARVTRTRPTQNEPPTCMLRSTPSRNVAEQTVEYQQTALEGFAPSTQPEPTRLTGQMPRRTSAQTVHGFE